MDEYDDDIDYSEDADEEDDSELAIEESPDIIDEADEYDDEFHPSVAWDFKEGDFRLDGNGNMIKCTGEEAYKVWCVKTVLTEREACRAYDSDIGAELDDALDWDDHGIVESELRRTITEAIMVNPRTETVNGFSFKWDGDNVTVTCVITPISGDEFTITI